MQMENILFGTTLNNTNQNGDVLQHRSLSSSTKLKIYLYAPLVLGLFYFCYDITNKNPQNFEEILFFALVSILTGIVLWLPVLLLITTINLISHRVNPKNVVNYKIDKVFLIITCSVLIGGGILFTIYAFSYQSGYNYGYNKGANVQSVKDESLMPSYSTCTNTIYDSYPCLEYIKPTPLIERIPVPIP